MPCNTVSLVSQNEPSALSMVPFIVVLMPPADNVGFSVVSSSLAWNLGQNRKYVWRKGASTGVWKFHYLLIDDVSSLIYYAEKMQIPLCFTFGDAFWIKKKLNWIWKRHVIFFFLVAVFGAIVANSRSQLCLRQRVSQRFNEPFQLNVT